jgi:hypothetical protein
MRVDDEKIVSLREKVNAAQQEFDMAVASHEVWKSAVFDNVLHTRLRQSYAANAFNVVQTALRREMLLALMRLWDNPKDSRPIAMERIADTLSDKDVIDALAADRAARIMPEAEYGMRKELGQLADKAIALIRKYSKDGSDWDVRRRLKRLRNEQLAHRQTATANVEADPSADEIESFYLDMSEIIRLLLSLVLGNAYNPKDTGGVYHYYSEFFWASVRGERTEGHPNYRAPIV